MGINNAIKLDKNLAYFALHSMSKIGRPDLYGQSYLDLKKGLNLRYITTSDLINARVEFQKKNVEDILRSIRYSGVPTIYGHTDEDLNVLLKNKMIIQKDLDLAYNSNLINSNYR